MFRSFFPEPRLFFISLVVWATVCVTGWYTIGDTVAGWIGLGGPYEDIIGVGRFWSAQFIWFYIYYAIATGLFSAFWWVRSRHEWLVWSILGSALILFVTSFQVQVSVVINDWYGPFYDLIQKALAAGAAATDTAAPAAGAAKSPPVTLPQFYAELATFAGIATIAVIVGDLHRILRQGGVFLYPGDSREGFAKGRLRLTYEAFPMAYLIEQAGGTATDGTMPILDRVPESLHEHTPLIFGSAAEMAAIHEYLSH